MSTICPSCRKTAAYCTCSRRLTNAVGVAAWLAAAFVVVALLVGPFVTSSPRAPLHTPHPASTVAVPVPDLPEEDEPGWDCRVHGNGLCGPGEVKR